MTEKDSLSALEEIRALFLARNLPHYQIPHYLSSLKLGKNSPSHARAINEAIRLEKLGKNRPQVLNLLTIALTNHRNHIKNLT